MDINIKYQPLFRLQTRYCVVTGGRGSAKSFTVSEKLLCETFDGDGTILFTRYTMTSAEISIIPEFWEKVELMGYEDVFIKTQDRIINRKTGGTILFRGLKTSAGKQTANLKSIPNLVTWVIDEAEEMTDEDMFDKIDLSLRKLGKKITVILVLNPPSIKHMIYRKFFKERGVFDVCNRVVGDCTYIHTTYLDNIKNLDATFLELAEKAKKDPDRYDNIFLGHWAKQAEGVIFKNWRSIKDSDYPTNLPCWYGLDWGYSNDPTAIVRICYDNKINALYLHEICYQKELQNNTISQKIKSDFRDKRTFIYQDAENEIYIENKQIHYNGKIADLMTYEKLDIDINPSLYTRQINTVRDVLTEVYCDPSRPEHISELRKAYGISSMGAVNTDKVGRIEFLKYFNVFYTESSTNIADEVDNYRWLKKKGDEKILINEPQDGDDHLIDATLYGAVTHLRRLGVVNDMGEK